MEGTTHRGLYILDGHIPTVVDTLTWGAWFETHSSERIVKQETIGPYLVSTVFLGIDHNFHWHDAGPPILFETMVFDDNGDETEQVRCATWEEAEVQHARIADEIRRKESK